MTVLFLIFLRKLCAALAAPVYISSKVHKEPFLFSISLPTLVICCLLMVIILTSVRSQLIIFLTCIPLIVSDIEHIFICFSAIFGKISIQFLCLFLVELLGFSFFLMLSCISPLYIFLYLPHINILFANISSLQLSRLPFHSLIVSFTEQNPSSFMQFQLFIFAFVSFASGDVSKKILLRKILKTVQPMFFL